MFGFLRGNHESKATSGFFGFKEECEAKYGLKMFLKCCEVFLAMPIDALVFFVFMEVFLQMLNNYINLQSLIDFLNLKCMYF